MSVNSIIVEGVLNADGTLHLDASPPIPPGRVRVTLQVLAPVHDDEQLDWAEPEYDSIPLKRTGQVNARMEQRGRLKPMPHDLDEE